MQISRFTASKPSKSAIASVKKFTRQLTTLIVRYFLKEISHNARGPLAGEFQPPAACKFLDLPPGSADPFSLKTVHWTVFRALEPSKPAEFAVRNRLKFPPLLNHSILRYFLKIIHQTAIHRKKYIYMNPCSSHDIQSESFKRHGAGQVSRPACLVDVLCNLRIKLTLFRILLALFRCT